MPIAIGGCVASSRAAKIEPVAQMDRGHDAAAQIEHARDLRPGERHARDLRRLEDVLHAPDRQAEQLAAGR